MAPAEYKVIEAGCRTTRRHLRQQNLTATMSEMTVLGTNTFTRNFSAMLGATILLASCAWTQPGFDGGNSNISLQAVSSRHVVATHKDGTVEWFDTASCGTTAPMCSATMIGAFASSIRAATTSAIEAGEVTDAIAGDNFAAFGANLTIHCSIARHFCDPLTSLRTPGPVTATIVAAGHLLVSNSARVFDFETHL